MGHFDGRVAIVTGSGTGIGHDLAIYLAFEGCKVVTNNRKPGSTMQTHDGKVVKLLPEDEACIKPIMGDAGSTVVEIIAAGGEAVPVYASVATPEGCKKLVDAAIEKWGRVDILVNNGASTWTGNVKDMDVDIWDVCIESKLSSSFYLMHYALPAEAGYYLMLDLRRCTPYEVGFDSMVDFSKDFAGKRALRKVSRTEPARELVGIEVPDYDAVIYGGPDRKGNEVYKDGRHIGYVTKFTYGFTIEKNIGYALLDKGAAQLGDVVKVNDRYDAIITPKKHLA